MTERRSFEQIDLTGQIPMWRMIDDRNREICSAAPLVYYNVVRPTSARMESGESAHSRGESASSIGPIVPIAMGSLHETGEVTSDLATAAGAAEREEEDTAVPSEAVPTSVAEEVELDKEVEAELLQELNMNLKTLESELETRLGESLENLKDLVPGKRGNDESHLEFETRVKSWLEDMETRHPSLLDSAKTLAEGLIDGSSRKDGYLEGFAMAKEKRKRISKMDQGPPKETVKTTPPLDVQEELKIFDLIQSFIAQGKETADFHKQVSGFLEGLQGRLDAPLEKFPQIVPELSNIIQEIGKLLTASDAVQSRNLKSVEGLRGILEAVKWELSGKSIDRRAIPQWDKGNTSRIMNESTREVMAGIRWGLQEMNHAVREQGLLQEKQFKVLENIASSSQRTAELLELVNTRESKNQEALEKQKADKLLAEQRKMDAVRLKAQKDQEEKERLAKEEADRKRALQAELENANAGIEAAQKRAKMAQEAMAQTPTTPVHPPMMPAMPVGPVGYGQPGYGQPCGQPCFMGGMRVMPQQGFPPMQGQPNMQPTMQPTMPIFEGQQTMQPNMPGAGHQAPL